MRGIVPIGDFHDSAGSRFTGPDSGVPSTGGSKFMLKQKSDASYIIGYAINGNRDFESPCQDIVVEFNSQVQDADLSVGDVATGHVISVNGESQTTTYRSGSGTGRWVLRIPVLVSQSDTITYTYDESGNTTAVDTGDYLVAVSDIKVDNFLTKKIRFILKKSDGIEDASETVNVAICKYSTEILVNDPWAVWMNRQQQQAVTTDSTGLIDMDYIGLNAVGSLVYVVVLRPSSGATESLIWDIAVQ